jgi:NADH dehydrogenase
MRQAVVFGGTGFLGRRVVRHLLDRGHAVRVASRHPERGRTIFPDDPPRLELVRAEIGEDASSRRALVDAFAVVNTVSLYLERGSRTFRSVHVEAAARLAAHARAAGATRLVHVSGIGADPASPSPYIRSRGEGEIAVRAAFPGATIVRPAVMFGPDDAFLTTLAALLRRTPAFALFGRGGTMLQPADVEDVGEAVARIADAAQAEPLYELAGPRSYSYRGLLETLCDRLGLRRPLVPVPFVIWQALAELAELLPRPPITRNQVELMRIDTVSSAAQPGFGALGIEPRGIETVLAARPDR